MIQLNRSYEVYGLSIRDRDATSPAEFLRFSARIIIIRENSLSTLALLEFENARMKNLGDVY